MARWLIVTVWLAGTSAPVDGQSGAAPPAEPTTPRAGATEVVQDTVPPSDSVPTEYDPGADRHYLLPTGRLAPAGTGAVGAGGLGFPPAAAPFVSGSFLPRTAIAAAVVVEPMYTGTTVTGSVAVQPVSIGKLDASLTAAGVSLSDHDDERKAGALVAAVSYGTDRKRATVALGSLRCCGEGEPFLALGGDVEVAGGDPRVAVIGGRPRIVRRRVKLIAEVYAPVGDGFGAGVAGLVGARFSGEAGFVNIVLPFAVGEGGSGAWLPLVSMALAF